MSYVLVGILFLIIACAFITYLMLTATRRSSPATADDETPGDAPGIGSDESPLGDTEQHAGSQQRGRTVAGQDAERSGGSGRPVEGARRVPDAAGQSQEESGSGGRFQRDPVGGEAEARPFTGSER